MFSSPTTHNCGTLNTKNVEIIPGSNIECYNRTNQKVRLSTFNDKLVLQNQVEDMENLCCTSSTTIILQSKNLAVQS